VLGQMLEQALHAPLGVDAALLVGAVALAQLMAMGELSLHAS